jgi:SAM-dependent methyltransferase
MDQVTTKPKNPAAATWDAGGEEYDEISRGVADAIEHCVERLQPKEGDRVLDVATGTGLTARRVAERGCNVSAIDFAPRKIAAAQAISSGRNYEIQFETGDAEALPYDDAAFDAVISTFGVMFAGNPEQAARELGRVCRPGGRLALATWSPDGNVFGMFKVMMPYMPKPAGDPPPSPFAWGDPMRVSELLGNDFDLTFERGTSFYREPDGEAAWRTFTTGYGPAKTLAGKLDDQALEQLHNDFVTFHNGFATELGITVPREYVVILGVRK